MPRQPKQEDFEEWLKHPISEWVFGLMRNHAQQQKEIWANKAWDDGDVSPDLLLEARVRADCYQAIPESDYEDWKTLDDTEN